MNALLALLRKTRWFGPKLTTDASKRAAIREMYAGYRESFAGATEIEAEDLSQRIEAGTRVVLIDVRGDKERQVSVIPGALTPEAFEAEQPEGLAVAYCTIGARSGAYAAKNVERGVHNLAGGILAWTHVGGALTAGDEPTQRVHVYGRPWALSADSYEDIW
ncbi:MAG: rhodanese-like domain-containing protein [Proteobacteria bacterium]|nr:rhodanese-like domain-containing protein [Pseudomonadota bacterium]